MALTDDQKGLLGKRRFRDKKAWERLAQRVSQDRTAFGKPAASAAQAATTGSRLAGAASSVAGRASGLAGKARRLLPSSLIIPKDSGKLGKFARGGLLPLYAAGQAVDFADALGQQNLRDPEEVEDRGGFLASASKDAFPMLSAVGQTIGEGVGSLTHGNATYDPNEGLVAGPGLLERFSRNYADFKGGLTPGATVDRFNKQGAMDTEFLPEESPGRTVDEKLNTGANARFLEAARTGDIANLRGLVPPKGVGAFQREGGPLSTIETTPQEPVARSQVSPQRTLVPQMQNPLEARVDIDTSDVPHGPFGGRVGYLQALGGMLPTVAENRIAEVQAKAAREAQALENQREGNILNALTGKSSAQPKLTDMPVIGPEGTPEVDPITGEPLTFPGWALPSGEFRPLVPENDPETELRTRIQQASPEERQMLLKQFRDALGYVPAEFQ